MVQVQVQVQCRCSVGVVKVWWECRLHGKEGTRVTRDTRVKGPRGLGLHRGRVGQEPAGQDGNRIHQLHTLQDS